MRKLKTLNSANQSCLNCPPKKVVLSMSSIVAVGFGDAHVEVDGKIVFREDESKDFKTVRKFELMARKKPRGDWRIVLNGPLSGHTYQRQGKNNWVLVKKNMGFA